MAVNSATVIGNLGGDPQVHALPSGQKVANVSVATTERYTDRNGGKQQRTEWHRIVAFGKLAETFERYLGKGRQVYVERRLTTRAYEAKDGSGNGNCGGVIYSCYGRPHASELERLLVP